MSRVAAISLLVRPRSAGGDPAPHILAEEQRAQVAIAGAADGAEKGEVVGVASLFLGQDPLPQFRGQLDAVLFHGLLGPGDAPTPAEGGWDSAFAMMKALVHVMTSRAPADELWLHHVRPGTVIAGENLAWYYPAEAYRQQPFMARKMLKPDKVWIWTMPRKVGDPATVAGCWRRILAWPARTVMTYHDVPGHAIRGDARAALAAAVEESSQLGGRS
jgi:hypothetical protein